MFIYIFLYICLYYALLILRFTYTTLCLCYALLMLRFATLYICYALHMFINKNRLGNLFNNFTLILGYGAAKPAHRLPS